MSRKPKPPELAGTRRNSPEHTPPGSDKDINTLKQTNKLDDKTIDDWPHHVLSHFLRLVQDEVKMLPHHEQELQLNAKLIDPLTGKSKPVHDARSKTLVRNALPVLDLGNLNDDHVLLYNQTWCNLDALLEVINSALAIKPFRREPP